MAKKAKSKQSFRGFVFAQAKPVKYEPPKDTAISNSLVMRCVACGKLRYKWEESKRIKDNSKYCSDDCKASHSPRRVAIKKSVREAVMQRDHGKCRYCGKKARHIDHIVPYSKGGSNSMTNLVAACTTCNCAINDRAFKSFDDKKAWILRYRGIILDDIQIETINLPGRMNWQAWVYGGMKSLKNKRRKS